MFSVLVQRLWGFEVNRKPVLLLQVLTFSTAMSWQKSATWKHHMEMRQKQMQTKGALWVMEGTIAWLPLQSGENVRKKLQQFAAGVQTQKMDNITAFCEDCWTDWKDGVVVECKNGSADLKPVNDCMKRLGTAFFWETACGLHTTQINCKCIKGDFQSISAPRCLTMNAL